jgi:hypothetical protein
VGLGTYTASGSTLARTTVFSSSNSDALVPFGAGTKDVFVTQPAERAVYVLGAGTGLAAGAAAFTANGVPYADSTSTLTTGSALTFDGTTVGVQLPGRALNIGTTSAANFYSAYRYNSADIGYIGNGPSVITAGISATDFAIGTASTNPLLFAVNSAEQMRLNSTGLGIGTSSPGVKLEVNGTIRSGTGSGETLSVGSVDVGKDVGLADGQGVVTGGARVMTFRTSGNVGIGTSSPAYKLHVLAASGYTAAFRASTAATTGILVGNTAGDTSIQTLSSGDSLIGSDSGKYLAFGTNGFVERMRITSAGDVGIGTSSPASKLDVNGTISVAGLSSVTSRFFGYSGSYAAIQIGAPSSNNGNVALGVNVNAVAGSAFNGQNQVILPNNGALFVNAAGTDFIGAIRRDSSNRILLGPTNASGLTAGDVVIDTGGNVGIGTTSPTAKLNVVGGNIRLDNNQGLEWGGGNNFIYGNETSDFIAVATNGTERARIDSSGNLGLGVTPSDWSSASRPALQLPNGAAMFTRSGSTFLGQNFFYNNSDTGTYIANGFATIYNQTSGQHQWFNAPSGTANNTAALTQAMTLDASGNLGVGETSPAFGLGSGVQVTRSGIATLRLQNSAGSNSFELAADSTANGVRFYGLNNAPFIFSPSATERMRLDSSGNLGLGVTPSAWFASSKAFQFGTAGVIEGRVGAAVAQFGCNWYIDSAGTYKYTTTAEATRYSSTSGQHAWHTAASGTAGNTISWTQAMTLDASGNLVIGDTSGTARLEVKAVGVMGRFKTGAATDGRVEWAYNTTDIGYIGADSSTEFSVVARSGNVLKLGAGGSERARITSGGYFKASNSGTYTNATGTYHEFYQTANSEALVVRNTNASQTSDTLFVQSERNTTNNSFYAINYYNGGAAAYKFRVADSGDVTNTNGTYGTISDQKMKTDIVDAGSQWADIKALRFRKFKMKDDPSGLVQLGVVAQEVELTSPGLVDEHQDRDAEGNDLGTTTKSVKTSVLLMKAAVALQEAMSRIEALEAQVAQLKGA